MPSLGLLACLACAALVASAGAAAPTPTLRRRPAAGAVEAARVIVGVAPAAPGLLPGSGARIGAKGAILAATRALDLAAGEARAQGAAHARLEDCLGEAAGALHLDEVGLAVLRPGRCGLTPKGLCAAVAALGAEDIFCEEDAAIHGLRSAAASESARPQVHRRGSAAAAAVGASRSPPEDMLGRGSGRPEDGTDMPNDPQFGEQWALGGGAGATQWGDAFRAGLLPGEPKQGKVVVAVLDTGVDITHPDLNGSLWRNAKEEQGASGGDDDGNGYVDDVFGWDFVAGGEPHDLVGTGTQMAGIIAARTNNSVGISGFSNDSVAVMPLRVIADDGSGFRSDAILALTYAMKQRAHVVHAAYFSWYPSRAELLVVEALGANGSVVVAGSGDNSVDSDARPVYPCAQPGVLCVASLDLDGHLSNFSGFGAETVGIAAPGSRVLSTSVNGTYANMSSTAMAMSHVSALLAALMARSLNGCPDCDRPEALNFTKMIQDTGNSLQALEGKVSSGKSINASRALGPLEE